MADRFYQGQLFSKEEGLHYELKEVRGGKPVDSINDSHEYVVAFLNAAGGSIYWGIRDSDGLINGVHLNRADRNSIQTILSKKIRGIQPPIAPEAFQIKIHEIYDQDSCAPVKDLHIVEISVRPGSPDVLYFTESGKAYIKQNGEKIVMKAVDINNEIARRARKVGRREHINQRLHGKEFVADKLSRYKWKHAKPMLLYPPIPSSRIQCRVLDGCKVAFAAPPEELAEVFRRNDPHMLARLDEAHFSRRDQGLPAPSLDAWSLFRKLTEQQVGLEKAKQTVFNDYMTEQRTINFNGKNLGLSGIRQGRTIEELPSLSVDLFRTDYYSYRVIGELCEYLSRIGELPWDRYFSVGLSEYLAIGAQQGVHLGAGVAIILHTLQDNKFVLTRRSANSTNTAGEAGKLFMSSNEGFNEKDIPDGSRISLHDVVQRALREELLGGTLGGPELPRRMRDVYVTGAYLYMPTFSVDLCIYASIDCGLADVKVAYPLARDSLFETSGIVEGPQADLTSVGEFLESTVSLDAPSDTWDEGALSAFLCAAVCLPDH